MTIPSVGDIFTTSQVAWKIGRSFSAGRENAPAEFGDVETEISGLARALKLLAEAMYADAGKRTLQEADKDIQDSIGTILASCQRIINDLDSLIDQYQIIRRHPTVGGFAVERSWSDIVVAEYRVMIWTAEGGNIQNLRDQLKMHTIAITVLTQAMQRDTPSQLESAVAHMAERIKGMCHEASDLDQRIDEMLHMVQDFTLTQPSTQVPQLPIRNPARSPTNEAPNPWVPAPNSPSSPKSPIEYQSTITNLSKSPPRSTPAIQPTSPTSTALFAPSSPTGSIVTSKTILTQQRMSKVTTRSSTIRYSSSSYASSDAAASSIGWPSPGPLRDSYGRHPSVAAKRMSSLTHTPELREPNERADDEHLSLLPPPAMGYPTRLELERVTSGSSQIKLSPYPPAQPEIAKLHRSSTTASQKAAFEKEAFRNSAILCDIRGQLVEHSHQINEDDPRDVEMVTACDECRIAVVRKRLLDPEARQTRLKTSIWAFSDDGTVRLELKMDDDQMYIPYSSFFTLAKVSLTVPCELKFHDVRYGNRPVKSTKTTWVNYVFDTAQAAALFQNELMGRTLLGTYRTKKTMRIHSGLGKSFSYAEQMCALENLRVWEDNDTGAVIALIHFSASFRDGYLAFYLNSSTDPVRVKDGGDREVKIKGLRVPLEKGNGTARKGSGGAEESKKDKVITGAKIEFVSDVERRAFLALVEERQKNMIELPELLGVN